ncbi:MAG: LysR family transcriptional regulator [Candidatus Binatus sp.]|uniref:LysR family transcriptional regulator n=1 Tax=Candidatus Binatus sp. TaxID=2811406 RepID=UPI003BAFC619
MTDLNSLVIFAKVVEANGFSEAARRLKMPTSTVSRRIAELEGQLGVRLLERSTRSLRLTDVGAEVLEHAQRSAGLSAAVDDIVSNVRSEVSGVLRLSAPPSISESLIAPLVGAFQASYPKVRVQVLVTERFVDHIADAVDLVFRFGALKDSTLVARRILTYRHQLVASPSYLEKCKAPKTPQDLIGHRLLAFSFWKPENNWRFVHANGKKETVSFQPFLSNDYAGLAHALVAGAGIGDLPPVVHPELLRDGRLIEVMPKWHFRTFNLSLVHLGNRYIPRPVRIFEELAAQIAPKLFSTLPT